jgi:DNA-binding NarL/FixJ family response regulator
MATKRATLPRQTGAISVLVVDDHRTFAEALAIAVGMDPDIDASAAWSGLQAQEIVASRRPDVVLMDVEMPGLGGTETIRRIREIHPRARVIAVSAHDDDLSKGRAIEAGAIGYLSKLMPIAELPDIVRRAHAGAAIIEPEEAERLLRHLRHRRHQIATERQRANRLTPRQVQILQLLSDGVSSPDVAEQLNLQPSTLRTHVQNILMRLGVHSKVEAVAVAMRHGKISTES